MPLSLYIHYPFCRRRCPYCDFFKAVPKTGEQRQFVKTLLAEIDLAATGYDWAKGGVSSVYFGGGTPSLLSSVEIGDILDRLRGHWDIGADAEITVEANPGTLQLFALRQWREAGVNRLSVGAQSFSSRKLSLLYRDHDVADIHHAAVLASQGGFSNISYDLIFGLPGETLEEWAADLTAALALDPAHISLYNLEIHEGTPFHRWRESGRLPAIDADLEADLYFLAAERLTAAGFEHYEISNFARPGLQSRHNCSYWTRTPYLGFGPAAHSFDGGRQRLQNVTDLPHYYAAIEALRLPLAEVVAIGEQERIEEWIALRLRLRDGITRPEAVAELGDVTANRLWQRATLLRPGLLIIDPERIAMTTEGWFVENSVLGFLLEILQSAAAEAG